MQHKSKRGAANAKHQNDSELNGPSWDDLRVFAFCAEYKSIRKVAEILKTSDSTIKRRLDRFEERIGISLFTRHQSGLRITLEADSIIEKVNTMSKISFDIWRQLESTTKSPVGVVKVAVTEGIGTYWVTPKLIEFQKLHRLLTIDLQCAMEAADVAKLEADISIQFDRPENPNLITRKIGFLHTYPFVSREYAINFGVPKHRDELKNHRLVQQVTPQLGDAEYMRALGVESLTGIVGLRTNSSTATLYAVERGAGIGVLPTCSVALGLPLVPIDVGINAGFQLWLTYHPDLRRSEKHMIVTNWLVQIFDPTTYPCFRAEFVHPTALVAAMSETAKTMSVKDYGAAMPK